MAASSEIDPELIRQTTQNVLGGADYDLSPASKLDLFFWEEIAQTIIDWLKPINKMFRVLYEISPVLAWAVTLLLFLILIALIVHIIYSFRVALQIRRRVHSFGQMAVEERKKTRDWEKMSETSAEQGEYLFALRYLFRAVLQRLEDSTRQSLHRGITNRELLRRFRKARIETSLASFVELVDLKWYGDEFCSEKDVVAAQEMYKAICLAAKDLEPPASKARHALPGNFRR